ncbi:MAG: type II toxin-antitoxin system ParD family antitoxin [Cyanobacteria bacterium P01_G01_bin.67]
MNIEPKSEQEKFIRDKITSGAYNNAGNVIAETSKLLEIKENKLKELQNKIAVDAEQVAKGQLTDGEEVFNRLQDRIERLASKSDQLVFILPPILLSKIIIICQCSTS